MKINWNKVCFRLCSYSFGAVIGTGLSFVVLVSCNTPLTDEERDEAARKILTGDCQSVVTGMTEEDYADIARIYGIPHHVIVAGKGAVKAYMLRRNICAYRDPANVASQPSVPEETWELPSEE